MGDVVTAEDIWVADDDIAADVEVVDDAEAITIVVVDVGGGGRRPRGWRSPESSGWR